MKTDPERLAATCLKADEALLWYGRPKQPRFGLGGWVIYGVLYVYCVFDMTTRGWHQDDFLRFMDNVIFLLLSFLYLIAWLVVYLRRRKIVYAVTDKRVFMVIDGKPDSLLSFRTIDTNALEVRRESRDGSGDLQFAVIEKPDKTLEVSLRAVPNVRDVERLIRRTFDEQPAGL